MPQGCGSSGNTATASGGPSRATAPETVKLSNDPAVHRESPGYRRALAWIHRIGPPRAVRRRKEPDPSAKSAAVTADPATRPNSAQINSGRCRFLSSRPVLIEASRRNCRHRPAISVESQWPSVSTNATQSRAPQGPGTPRCLKTVSAGLRFMYQNISQSWTVKRSSASRSSCPCSNSDLPILSELCRRNAWGAVATPRGERRPNPQKERLASC